MFDSLINLILAIVSLVVNAGTDGSVQELRLELELNQAGMIIGEVTFEGMLESMGDGVWVVSGIQVQVGAATEIDESLQVGDRVRVEAMVLAGGGLIAREIGSAPRAVEAPPDEGVDEDEDQVEDGELQGTHREILNEFHRRKDACQETFFDAQDEFHRQKDALVAQIQQAAQSDADDKETQVAALEAQLEALEDAKDEAEATKDECIEDAEDWKDQALAALEDDDGEKDAPIAALKAQLEALEDAKDAAEEAKDECIEAAETAKDEALDALEQGDFEEEERSDLQSQILNDFHSEKDRCQRVFFAALDEFHRQKDALVAQIQELAQSDDDEDDEDEGEDEDED